MAQPSNGGEGLIFTIEQIHKERLDERKIPRSSFDNFRAACYQKRSLHVLAGVQPRRDPSDRADITDEVVQPDVAKGLVIVCFFAKIGLEVLDNCFGTSKRDEFPSVFDGIASAPSVVDFRQRSVFDHGLGLYTFRLFSPPGSERLHFTTSGLKKQNDCRLPLSRVPSGILTNCERVHVA